MDHSTAPLHKKRIKICKFFRKLTSNPFFHQQTIDGHLMNIKNGLPNQSKNTFNEITSVPESNSIHSIDGNIENSESTNSLNTSMEEVFSNLLERAPTTDIISIDGVTDEIFHTPSMQSMDSGANSSGSIQSIHSPENKSDSFFFSLIESNSKQTSVVSESKSESSCKCSFGKILFFCLIIVIAIISVYVGIPVLHKYYHGNTGRTNKPRPEKFRNLKLEILDDEENYDPTSYVPKIEDVD